MSEVTYSINIPSEPSAGMPLIKANFGRVTVLIGANGSGKSRVLKRLVSRPGDFGSNARPVTYIEGGRVIQIPQEIKLNFVTFEQFSTLPKAELLIKENKTQNATNRIGNVLLLLDRRASEVKVRHSEAVTKWLESGSQGECPVLEENPLERLFEMFSEVFPEIKLKCDAETKQLNCEKNGSIYLPDGLSDGERQAFFILADIASTTAPDSLIIVDEPELNLNALLAVRLWNTIEDRLPNAIFVYGTHSISFVMRQNVDCVIALSRSGLPAVVINDINEIPSHDAREFLGAIPAILSSPGAIAVEGMDTSFDGGFYRWLIEKQEIAVVPLGGNTDVTAAVTRSGIWDKLAPNVQLVGVIDRDYRSDTSQDNINNKCIVLDVHEAESYLCHPQVLVAVANALGTAEHIPTEVEIRDLIFDYFEQVIFRIAVNRMAFRAQVRLNVSLPGAAIKGVEDVVSLRKLIEQEAIKEEAKASHYVGSVTTLTIFDEEMKRCRKALNEKDIDEVLKLAPGKEILARLAPRVGCKDTAAVARAAYKHLDISNFINLDTLRNRIKAAMSI